MLMLVRSFVRPFGPNLSRAVNFQLSRSDSTQRANRDVRERSVSIQRAFRASKSESYSRSLKYCVLFCQGKCKCQVVWPQVPCHTQQLDQLRDLLCVWISVPPRTFDFGEEQTSENLVTKGESEHLKTWREFFYYDGMEQYWKSNVNFSWEYLWVCVCKDYSATWDE